MDDVLERPSPQQPSSKDHNEEDQSSGDEDGGLDWTKLPGPGTTARPVIPKRGEKDFEPTQEGGSGLQLHVLDRARGAMVEALRAGRSISSKSISYGIWYPSIDRVHVTTARGIHFSTMGHSVARGVSSSDNPGDNEADRPLNHISGSKLPKRLELLPEEAIYLVERGALFCYKPIAQESIPGDSLSPEEISPGSPMSVQQAFAEMIGREGMTLERYQVYAYLKRLGFVLTRADPPTIDYPVAAPPSLPITRSLDQPRTVWHRLAALFSRLDVFKALRFIPCGHLVPLHKSSLSETRSIPSPESVASASSPYKVFFHVYKPSTPFRKTAPPAPDFYVVVVNARTTAMPSLHELTSLFYVLPEMPLPPPRKRGIQASTKKPNNVPTVKSPSSNVLGQASHDSSRTAHPPIQSSSQSAQPQSPTLFQHLTSFIPLFRTTAPKQITTPTFVPNRPNPFLALKTGTKTIVVAAVDSGSISFFRFGEGVFEEWPMA
ncbi:hypothetical protein HYDPIDRAFT_175586 [Hydnomerulius pinastri MD-312]|uniref:tRNA-splicing endonuclease subunit Sen54 N-terminal domain-containing protein n=1 Tax=Hydnomerulius pinastri MD-312 TaxID=994086 RepID=A0A0C9WFC2_9AGAM|nr:hypothetical protein HYDPIDRAFT_175586 [Hydnomerulius pinastri MD-312]